MGPDLSCKVVVQVRDRLKSGIHNCFVLFLLNGRRILLPPEGFSRHKARHDVQDGGWRSLEKLDGGLLGKESERPRRLYIYIYIYIRPLFVADGRCCWRICVCVCVSVRVRVCLRQFKMRCLFQHVGKTRVMTLGERSNSDGERVCPLRSSYFVAWLANGSERIVGRLCSAPGE